MYNWLNQESDDLPRDVSAAGAGFLSGLLGGAVPVIGAATGLGLQIWAAHRGPSTAAVKGHPLWNMENIGDGLFDGFLAVTLYQLFR